jgi:hypothetical protein
MVPLDPNSTYNYNSEGNNSIKNIFSPYLCGGLAIGSSNLNGTLVDLNTRQDTSLIQHINKGLPILGLLVEGLLKEDDTTEVLKSSRSAEKELTQGTAVLLHVLNVDA